MTCIIGVVEKGQTYIGGDSALSTSGTWEVRASKLPKVFRIGKFIIGFTGSPRLGQLLRYYLEIHPQGDETDEAYIVQTVIEAARKIFKEHGFAKVEDNVEEGGNFLLGYKGRLWWVDYAFSLCELTDSLDALGCGREYALGAMRALENLPPRERILKALEIAEHFSGALKRPFLVLVDPEESEA